MIAFDTNLLVYAHRTEVLEHPGARRAIEQARRDRRGWGIALPCIAEFWSIVTHRTIGSTAPKAHTFLAAMVVEAEGAVWLPSQNFWDRLARLASDLGVTGARIFDLQIALIARENGASELWTHDSGFTPIPGLRIHDPLRTS